jgi:hypothetical protein
LSTSIIAFVLILVGAISSKKKQKYIALLMLASVGYISVFINLNIVHAYYQIPLLYSMVACLLIAITKEDKKNDMKFNRKGFLLSAWILGLSLNLLFTPAKGYLQAIQSDDSSGVVCPINSKVVEPVLSVNIPTGPTLFYKCELDGFNVLTSSSAQVNAAYLERKDYKFAYFENDANFLELESFLSQNGGKVEGVVSRNWVSINWN